jgi:hypothetical protein
MVATAPSPMRVTWTNEDRARRCRRRARPARMACIRKLCSASAHYATHSSRFKAFDTEEALCMVRNIPYRDSSTCYRGEETVALCRSHAIPQVTTRYLTGECEYPIIGSSLWLNVHSQPASSTGTSETKAQMPYFQLNSPKPLPPSASHRPHLPPSSQNTSIRPLLRLQQTQLAHRPLRGNIQVYT